MMGIRRLTTANQAGLVSDISDVVPVANPTRLSHVFFRVRLSARYSRGARMYLRAIGPGEIDFGMRDVACRHFLRCKARFRRRTPGPPPFSSMNSTPAVS